MDACHLWHVEVFPNNLSQEDLDALQMYAIYGELFFDMPMGKRYKDTLDPTDTAAQPGTGHQNSTSTQNQSTLRLKLKLQQPKGKFSTAAFRLAGIDPPAGAQTSTSNGSFSGNSQVLRLRNNEKKNNSEKSNESGATGYSHPGANNAGRGGASGSGASSGINGGATGSSSGSGGNAESPAKEDFKLNKANFPPLPAPNQKRKD
ncbi:uncharacterized protein Dana_GF21908 [Drosophila ananassae]|uniref:Uncharacterized protein n=2 Tax=Drosophila ananassae TaxID=7217 RepID=A0A0P8XGZ3_DROAN|nr:uncharacterized protein Dana_GF21908 [Drosophila ananassae]